MSNQKNLESLSKVTKDLMLIEPFYGLFLIALNKEFAPVKTACVGMKNLNFYLKIDPDFWNTLSHTQRLGLIKHELLHIAFFHLTDFKHLKEQDIANIAMDIEINQLINADWLPPNPMLPESFPELDLEYEKGTHYYYEKLIDAKEDSNNIQLVCIAAGNGETSVELPDGTKINLSNHDWEDVEEMDEATERLVKAQIGQLLEQVAEQVVKSQGSIPSEIEVILERLRNIEPPKFDWKGYMRRFVGKSTKIYTKKSRRKYNKRLPDFPGLKIKQQKHILVAIDTSGSVSDAELREFLGEIHHMYKTGAEVTIVQCDTAISWIGPFNPRHDFTIKGRGGTSFQPVIDYYNENMQKYSCMFYLTDGGAGAPDNFKGNILWVLSSNQSSSGDHLPGKVIQLN